MSIVPNTPLPGPPAAPVMQVRKEIRFAVVLYGGVSLAIYINGVVQELLAMVRATAANPADPTRALLAHNELTGSERIYRYLGQTLNADTASAALPAYVPTAPIHTRFLVDIISGTSAGGINGIYLAKALANQQSIDALASLWVEEGDILKLMNDAPSRERGVPFRDPPLSLLNSQRMYRKLYEAFEGMDQQPAASSSALADEVDCFVTTTDIRGLPIFLRLSDEVVSESRHRNFFHFRYTDARRGIERNDFGRPRNPLLAFAARCTSSFPFAFEPMLVKDVEEILARPIARKDVTTGRSDWDAFFPSYRPPTGAPEALARSDVYDFRRHSFGDGGYLDNKPFSFAIDALVARRGSAVVDRKLLYVEPSPEHPEDVLPSLDGGPLIDRPSPVENIGAALSLARSETIRDDVMRIIERNRLLDRVTSIFAGLENDEFRRRRAVATKRAEEAAKGAAAPAAAAAPDPAAAASQFAANDLATMITTYGAAYGGYQRLKVGAVTDRIAEIVARLSGIDGDSDEYQAIRYLIRAWRDMHYVVYAGDAPIPAGAAVTVATQNAFVLAYDLRYRIRRLDFVLSRLDALYCLDARTARILDPLAIAIPGVDDVAGRTAFRDRITALATPLSAAYASLRGADDAVTLERLPDDLTALATAVREIGISQETMLELMARPSDADRRARAAELVRGKLAKFQGAATALATWIATKTRPVSATCTGLLPAIADDAAVPATIAELAAHYYNDFERYDMVMFPVRYSTTIGEELAPVAIVRVSPEDAYRMLDERPIGQAEQRHKLAGTAFGHFGAFLDRRWRVNDIMWGRLDGAERIIATLTAGTSYAAPPRRPGEAPPSDPNNATNRLIEAAQLEVLDATMRPPARAAMADVVVTAMQESDAEQLLPRGPQNTPAERAIDWLRRKVAQGRAGKQVQPHLAPPPGQRVSPAHEALRTLLTDTPALRTQLGSTTIDPTPNPTTLLSTLSRSTRIVGLMLDGMANGNTAISSSARWVTRAGTLFWGLVEVAVPRTWQQLLFRYWVRVLIIAEVLLIIGGIVFSKPQAQQVGVILLAITIAVRIAVAVIGDTIAGRVAWKWVLRAGLIAVFALGVLYITRWAGHDARIVGCAIWDRLPASLRGSLQRPGCESPPNS